MTDPTCIFCRIIAGEIPGQIVHQDGDVVAFRDVQPAAPTHVLVVTRDHIPSLDAVAPEQWPLVTRCLEVAQQIARQEGIAAGGYRVINNIGPNSGQAVPHLHWHVIGGRPLGALVGR